MKFLVSLILWELRFQFLSLRTRAAMIGYVALCLSAPVYVLVGTGMDMESTRFVGHLLEIQPFLTVCLAILIAGHRSAADAWPEMRLALASAPVRNLSFLTGRWMAQLVLLLPMTVLPLIGTMGLAAHHGWQGHDLAGWISAWALRILPLAVITCAAWLGAVTIFGHELAALGATTLGGSLFLSLLNKALFPLRWHVGSLNDWIGLTGVAVWFERLTGMVDIFQSAPRYFPVSESPFDARLAWQWLLPKATVALGLSLCILAIAIAYVRRSRRDVRPFRVRPDHPLRTYLLLLFRLREQLTPGAGLGTGDRLAIAFGIALLCGSLAFVLELQSHFQNLADERYEAERNDFPPTSSGIVPLTWRLEGALDQLGAVEMDVRGTLVNQSRESVVHLAFSLNEQLSIQHLEVLGQEVSVLRSWDRVRVTLDPPLRPGETLTVHSQIAGIPGEIQFPLRYPGRASFITNLETFRTATFARDLVDFSNSRLHRAASPKSLELHIADLSLVPRFTPWKLTPFTNKPVESGLQVPEENILHPVDLEVAIDMADRWFAADPCGHRSVRGRLEGQCRTALSEYGLFGGRFEASSDGQLTIAAYPPHRQIAEELRESLSDMTHLSARAWPGMPAATGLVVIEWPRIDQIDPMWIGPYQVRGQLVLLSSSVFNGRYRWRHESLVSQLLVRDLLGRRSVSHEQNLFFHRFIQILLLQRMDLSRHKNAIIDGDPGVLSAPPPSILTAEPYDGRTWYVRLAAVLHDLRARIGSPAIVRGVDAFLAAGPEPGNFDQLLASLEQESGVSLQRFADDFIRGTAVPVLELDQVESQRDGEIFRVRGVLRNIGRGQVTCPIVVKTAVNQLQTLVTVDSESQTPFELQALAKPLMLQLDPKGTCYRMYISLLSPSFETIDLEALP